MHHFLLLKIILKKKQYKRNTRQSTDSNLIETVDSIELPKGFAFRYSREGGKQTEVCPLTPSTKLKQFTLTREHVL